MVVIKKQNNSIIVSPIDSFNSLKECVDFLIPNSTKIKPSYMPFGNVGVYQLNDKVFKFSFVFNEAKACCRIMDGDNFKNIVNVFSVHKIFLNKKIYYLIEMEKLNKIKKVTFDYLDVQSLYEDFDCKLTDLLNFITNLIKCYIDLKKTKMVTKDNKNVLRNFPELEDIINIYEGFGNVKDTIYYIENLIKGCLELKSIGIIHKDLHSDNLLVDNKGVYKIIDFGVITLKRKF